MADTKKIVQLQDENGLFIYPTTTLEAIAGSNTLRDNFVQKIGDTMSGPLQATGFIGPLTGNATSADKLNTDKGSASNPVYFLNGIPVACTGTTVPTGGSTGQVLIKKSDGGVEWKELVALPKDGDAGQALIKNSTTDGDASWKSSSISWVAGSSGGPQPKIFDITGNAIPTANTSASGIVTTGDQTFAGQKSFNANIVGNANIIGNGKIFSQNSSQIGVEISTDAEGGNITIYAPTGNTGSTNYWQMDAYNGDLRWYRVKTDGTTTTGPHIKSSNLGIYGAVWNDYAEFRTQKEIIEPGYCVASSNNGEVYKTTEKFQACDGIVSDTFGFAIGETDECKTPLAVAGRVLAYYSGNREDYHAGDTVCAGPEGKVCKMTREEIREWPDRIVGIVSEIPEYETWGSGNIKVNNRIWIKVK